MKLSRSAFIGGAVALGAECVMGANAAHDAGNAARLKVRFLGTGAADWNGRDARGELRRLSSILVDVRSACPWRGAYCSVRIPASCLTPVERPESDLECLRVRGESEIAPVNVPEARIGKNASFVLDSRSPFSE